ncbi:MAG: DUF6378 domain-containing protein, partial [Rickettsiales bacterium]
EWTKEQKSKWQERMFEVGIFWSNGSDNVIYLEKNFYYINNIGIGYGSSLSLFGNSRDKPMTYEDAFPSQTRHQEQQRAKERFDSSIDATLSERGVSYGEFKDGAKIMRDLKETMHSTEGWERLSPAQREALDMIQHKIGRILNGNPDYKDSWVDIAGYAKLISDNLQK